MKGNFDGEKFHDTVYVTANPQLEWNRDRIDTEFFEVINLWEDDEAWNEKHNTVMPEKVKEKALEVAEEYPDKRLLIHFMQPHYPFIFEGADEMGIHDYFWFQIMKGQRDTSKDEAWWYYTENLKEAVPSVQKLAEELEGETVVTADHGNMVGERSFPIPVKEWGHPNRTYVEKLTKVPWLVIESENRREITSEEPEKQSESTEKEENVKEKLQNLGYM